MNPRKKNSEENKEEIDAIARHIQDASSFLFSHKHHSTKLMIGWHFDNHALCFEIQIETFLSAAGEKKRKESRMINYPHKIKTKKEIKKKSILSVIG